MAIISSRFLLPLPLPSSSHRFLQTLLRRLLHSFLKLRGRIFFQKVQEGPPFEALCLILPYIPDRIDRLRFRSVCKSWHLAESLCCVSSTHPPLLVPSLFLQEKVPALSSQFSKAIYWLLGPKGINWALCSGSTTDGWLFMFNQLVSDKIFLVNFFSGQKIALPPMGVIPWQEIYPARMARFLSWFKWLHNMFFFEKTIILSSPQSNVQYLLVAANRCGFISLCKPGGISWTTDLTNDTGVQEIVFYKDKLHGINKQEELYLFDVINCEKGLPKVGNITNYNIPSRAGLAHDICSHKYIIHLCEHYGKLLMVLRYYKLEGFIMKNMKTVLFRVFELDETVNPFKWVELDNLGGDVMFLDNQGVRLFPKSEFECIKEDCIYFADESLGKCVSLKIKPDMGVYSMSNGCIEPFFVSDSLWSPSMWLLQKFSPSMWLFRPKFERQTRCVE